MINAPDATTRSHAKAVERESATAALPSRRSSSRLFGLLAVARFTPPSRRSTGSAARPTPPAAAWMRMRAPGRQPAAARSAASTVMNAVASVAACGRH